MQLMLIEDLKSPEKIKRRSAAQAKW